MSENLQLHEMYLMLVESSAVQSKLICQQFENLGIHNYTCVTTGQDALNTLLHDTPDLVISAYYLPDMTGTELITGIRQNPPLSEIPFMLISSETSFKALDPIRQAGVVAILPKPFDALDLKRALHTSLDFINVESDNIAAQDLADLQILLVDDSALARKHIRRVLNKLGIEVIDEAVNGLDAIPKIEQHFYDLIITDYNMPDMDGAELTRYIRNESSQNAIPVLMVTSENDENRLAGVQQSGVSGICDKPFDPQSVKAYLHKILLDV